MPKPRVVLALLSDEQEFQRFQAQDGQAVGKRLGLEVELLFAESNAVLQIQQIFHHIHAEVADRPTAIVTETVTGEGLERVARNAVGAGIAWVLLNRRVGYLEELRRSHPDLLVAAVSTDQREVGRIQARQCRALVAPGSRVLVVQGPPDTSVAQERRNGLEEELHSLGISTRVLNGDWSEASGEKAMSAWLRLGIAEAFHPDVIVSQNDAMALGVLRAIRAHQPEWERVPRIGCDGLVDGGQRLVARGELRATVVVPSNAGPAMEMVARWIDTHKLPPTELLLQPSPFTAGRGLGQN